MVSSASSTMAFLAAGSTAGRPASDLAVISAISLMYGEDVLSAMPSVAL